jgi:hypothetical protein
MEDKYDCFWDASKTLKLENCRSWSDLCPAVPNVYGQRRQPDLGDNKTQLYRLAFIPRACFLKALAIMDIFSVFLICCADRNGTRCG